MKIIKGNLYISEKGRIVEATNDKVTNQTSFSGIVVNNVCDDQGYKTNDWATYCFKPYEDKSTQNNNYEIY